MGLVKAAISAASGVMADQWKEYFYCDALPADVLAVKGQKRTDRRSSNKHGSENIISDGSIVAVADGQCALIVEQGKVVELCAEPGEYTYSTGTQPSLFSGGLKNIDDAFAEMGKRIGFGGQTAADQRLYYINTKELVGNKYGTPNPVPFRVVDQRAGIDIDIAIRCFGEYSYRIVNPILFYTNVCGNVENEYTRDARGSTNTFVERGIGDVLIAWENEALLAANELGNLHCGFRLLIEIHLQACHFFFGSQPDIVTQSFYFLFEL